MAEIVNLRSARKRRQREDAEAEAAANRVRHGLPKAARAVAGIETERAARDLDGHRLVTGDAPDISGER